VRRKRLRLHANVDNVHVRRWWAGCVTVASLKQVRPETTPCTLEAERQVRDFLIGPRIKKQQKKVDH
jgi:hypothetical protein